MLGCPSKFLAVDLETGLTHKLVTVLFETGASFDFFGVRVRQVLNLLLATLSFKLILIDTSNKALFLVDQELTVMD